MKRMSGKHLRGSQNRAVGRSPVKGKMLLFLLPILFSPHVIDILNI